MTATGIRKFTNQTHQAVAVSAEIQPWIKRNGGFRTKAEQANYLRIRNRREEAKIKVFKEYGGVCACCGEKNQKFLTIDHMNNDGYEHRRLHKGDIYKYLVKNGFPFEFQILCFNCNWGKEHNGGICPHKDL